MNTVFRRLSEEDLRTFRPMDAIYKWPGWKIGFVIILIGVCIKWIFRP